MSSNQLRPIRASSGSRHTAAGRGPLGARLSAVTTVFARVATAAAATAAISMLPFAAHAQEPADTLGADTVAIEPLVVTATRRPLALEAVPAAVTVLTGDELRARGGSMLADALRLTPGTPIVQTGSFGGLTSLYMRGGESDYVQVLVDGVPVNQPGGSFNFAHLRTEDVERVEIVRGPVSVLYGSDAVTGVIHVITRRGLRGPVITGNLSSGLANRVGDQADSRSGSLAFDAGVSGSSAAFDYAASAARFASDGAYAFNNDYDNTTASASLGWSNGASAVRLNGRYLDSEFHYPTNGSGAIVDSNAFRTGRAMSLGATASHDFGSRVRASVDFALNDDESGEDDAQDAPGDTLGFFASNGTSHALTRSIDGRIDFAATPDALLTLGAAAEEQDGDMTSLSMSEFGPFADSAEYGRSSRAGYAQLLLTPGTRTTLTGGARIDDGAYGTFVTWRAGASVRPGAWVIRAAAGSAFKEPTFYENYAQGFVLGNPTLDPERSLSFEVGVERALLDERVRIGATAYTQSFEDLIQYTAAPTRPGESNYFNLGEARARGIETSASVVLLPALQLDLAYDWLDTEVIGSGDAGDLTFVEGSRLLRRPEHRLSGGIGWTHNDMSAWLGVTRVGAREDIDFSDPAAPGGRRVTLDGYTLVNASAAFPIRRGRRTSIAATLRIENLFDARFQEIIGFPARGRAAYLGVSFELVNG